jgi:hypothetical protein
VAALQRHVHCDGLAAWWTSQTRGESEVDGILEFRFAKGGFDMRVLELAPGKRVLWKVVDGRRTRTT